MSKIVYDDYVNYNYKEDTYNITVPIGKQKLSLSMEYTDHTLDTVYFNVVLGVYTKRKHARQNEDNHIITGLDPLRDAVIARNAFVTLERFLLERELPLNNIVIYCSWVDNRRRDAYYRVLSKYGYNWGNVEGHKVIMKKYKKTKI